MYIYIYIYRYIEILHDERCVSRSKTYLYRHPRCDEKRPISFTCYMVTNQRCTEYKKQKQTLQTTNVLQTLACNIQ